ncbi:chaplin [Streptomyces sp. ME19-01-6]|uniref:chaplin n=1 Tax=Streptomyces sp. ME19-01-6 TaxID=3028686 RepID=UPI0029AD6A9D|nr:chaplin [Streptomyces sp. ME19-01-6]MDX3231612.1 chaplin [Streptomyces sp. ME19-01-6]
MKSIKKFAAVTIVAGGLAVAGAGAASAHSPAAQGQAVNSPGIASGNHVQAPVFIPVNACGNGAHVLGVMNQTFGTPCGNR